MAKLRIRLLLARQGGNMIVAVVGLIAFSASVLVLIASGEAYGPATIFSMFVALPFIAVSRLPARWAESRLSSDWVFSVPLRSGRRLFGRAYHLRAVCLTLMGVEPDGAQLARASSRGQISYRAESFRLGLAWVAAEAGDAASRRLEELVRSLDPYSDGVSSSPIVLLSEGMNLSKAAVWKLGRLDDRPKVEFLTTVLNITGPGLSGGELRKFASVRQVNRAAVLAAMRLASGPKGRDVQAALQAAQRVATLPEAQAEVLSALAGSWSGAVDDLIRLTEAI